MADPQFTEKYPNCRALFASVRDQYPHAKGYELAREFGKEIGGHPETHDELGQLFVRAEGASLLGSGKRYPREDAAQRHADRQRITKEMVDAVETRQAEKWLNMLIGDKELGDYTMEELAKLNGGFGVLAKHGQPGHTVRECFTEKEVDAIMNGKQPPKSRKAA